MQYTLNGDDLRLVKAIADAGSLRGAAERLAIDHSTVFRRLKAMEAALGVRLFDRSRQHCVPTREGAAAAEAASTCEETIDRLMLTIAGADTKLSGSIRLTTTDTMLYGPLPSVLAGFHSRHPEVQVELVETRTLLSLTRREADVALRPTQSPPENLVGRPIAAIRFSIWGRSEAFGSSVEQVLQDAPWVCPDPSLAHWAGTRWQERQVPSMRIRHRVNSLMGVFAAVSAGIGISVLPDYLAESDARLIRLGPPIPELAAQWWLLTHPELRNVARVRALIDDLAERLPPVLDR